MAVSPGKAVSYRKFASFIIMRSIANEEIPAKAECFSKVRNISDALYVLNGKWKFPLIFTLRESPLRFNEILKAVEGITPKVLAKELRELELNGMITRKAYPPMPGTVIYEATAYSDTLKNVLYELQQWGEQHRERIRQAIRDHQAGKEAHGLPAVSRIASPGEVLK